MSSQTKLSVKGQVVIPKDVRDALNLKPGETLNVKRVGNQIVMEAVAPSRKKISYEEFRKRIPKYDGPPVSIEEMNAAVDEMFVQKYRRS
jgi:AbrB family looped-hinge helix DNA binding protein